jgi:hypothetical protein
LTALPKPDRPVSSKPHSGCERGGRTVAKKDLAAENADLREVLLRIARKAASRSKAPIPANKTLGEIETVALNALETV